MALPVPLVSGMLLPEVPEPGAPVPGDVCVLPVLPGLSMLPGAVSEGDIDVPDEGGGAGMAGVVVVVVVDDSVPAGAAGAAGAGAGVVVVVVVVSVVPSSALRLQPVRATLANAARNTNFLMLFVAFIVLPFSGNEFFQQAAKHACCRLAYGRTQNSCQSKPALMRLVTGFRTT